MAFEADGLIDSHQAPLQAIFAISHLPNKTKAGNTKLTFSGQIGHRQRRLGKGVIKALATLQSS